MGRAIQNATLLFPTFASACFRVRLGVVIVIEDYIQKSRTRLALLIPNKFVVVTILAVATLSVVKICISSLRGTVRFLMEIQIWAKKRCPIRLKIH